MNLYTRSIFVTCRIVYNEIRKGNLPSHEYMKKFARVVVYVCLLKDDSKYMLESMMLNYKPFEKKKKSSMLEILLRASKLWFGCGKPH